METEETERCVNYEFCGEEPPKWVIDHHRPYCMTCDMFKHSKTTIHFNGTHQFRDTTSACCVCLEHKGREMKFPACSHWFCTGCCRALLYEDETRYHLNPESYGCPPCPNGCQNPTRGPQCYCMEWCGDDVGEPEGGGEDESIVGIWSRNNTDQYDAYCTAEGLSIDIGNVNGEVWGTQTCPLCRKKW